jgi:chemosensory pili system protein ChpA (sensor histidine kinase/response regulator)
VSETFDIGPLTWVHDEIKLALHQVEGHLETYVHNNQDVSPLRQALTHLNQVNGALDMVGLEGCKRFCFEIETLMAALEKKY